MAAMFGHSALGGRITALPPSVIVIGARRGSPLILGIGDDEYVLASPQGTDPREGSTTTTRRRACLGARPIPGLFTKDLLPQGERASDHRVSASPADAPRHGVGVPFCIRLLATHPRTACQTPPHGYAGCLS